MLAAAALLLVSLAGARAQNYVNNGTVVNQPNFNATNFLNNVNGVFSFTQAPLSPTWADALYQGWNGVINFTNLGEMDSVTGFRFDTIAQAAPFHVEAGSFYNAGSINCGTIPNIFLTQFIDNTGISYGGYGGLSVWASNIYNSGTITVGSGGLAIFNGDNINFNRGSVALLSPSIFLGQGIGAGTAANVVASGQADTSTNNWSPAAALQQNSAYAFLNSLPYFFSVFNSTPYVSGFLQDNTGTNIELHLVFLQDNSINVTTNVYDTGNGGSDVVEWAGSYVDPATGLSSTHYLYLYDFGANTNTLKYGNPGTGTPPNFVFQASDTPVPLGAPVPAANLADWSGYITRDAISNNIYSYVNAQLIATTVSAGGLALSNIPGNIQINASKSLNLSLANVSGMNYLKINSPNQFDTDGHSAYGAPFSDLYLGHTNGTMVVSNLVESYLPKWGGTVQAWSTQFTNSVNGTNINYRILLVGSQLNPITPAQVQDFVLNSSNNVVISDALNITRTFSINCTNLLVTTNGLGVGAASAQGILNLSATNFDWAASLPRLLCLTNQGTIQYPTAAQFESQSNALSVVPGQGAVAATGTLAAVSAAVNVLPGNKVKIWSAGVTNIYEYVGKLTNTIAGQVKIGGNVDSSLTNLIAAINHGTGAGSVYSSATAANPLVWAGALSSHGFTITADVPGAAGNAISMQNTFTTTNLAWNGLIPTAVATLAGGADATGPVTNSSPVMVPYYNFVNSGQIAGFGANIWSDNFENYGLFTAFTNGITVNSLTSTMTNGVVLSGGTFSDTAATIYISGTTIQAGKSLALTATNWLTDGGVNSSNFWSAGSAYSSYGQWDGLMLPAKPVAGDLLGTTITLTAVTNSSVTGQGTELVNIWSGTDKGYSVSGFQNNAAIGQLILDSQGQAPKSDFYFTGTGTSNAMYVDCLQLRNYASYTNRVDKVLPALAFNTNLVIYYAQALTQDGTSVAEKINGFNGNHLRWVAEYAGHFSSTNIVYPDGTTNAVNAALAQSSDLNSDGDGIVNYLDPTPVFVPSQIKLVAGLTNVPPRTVKIQWTTIPLAVNYIDYTTNLAAPNWQPFTNFNNYYYGANVAVPNAAGGNYFTSPQPVASGVVDNAGQTNVWVFDAITNAPRFYRVRVQPVYP